MHSVFLRPHSGADKNNFITDFKTTTPTAKVVKFFEVADCFWRHPQYLVLYIYAQNIRLHEYVVLVDNMSECGFYGCVPRMPKEHGMHRQITRHFIIIKGSGTETSSFVSFQQIPPSIPYLWLKELFSPPLIIICKVDSAYSQISFSWYFWVS